MVKEEELVLFILKISVKAFKYKNNNILMKIQNTMYNCVP